MTQSVDFCYNSRKQLRQPVNWRVCKQPLALLELSPPLAEAVATHGIHGYANSWRWFAGPMSRAQVDSYVFLVYIATNL